MISSPKVGTIARWGTKGYGFIEADGVGGQIWVHVKFLDDEAYVPRAGDRVEFELVQLPDGRHQAQRVRRKGGGAPSAAAAPAARVGTLGERLAATGIGALVVIAPPAAPTGIGEQIGARRRARDAELAKLADQASGLRRESTQLEQRARELAAQAERLDGEIASRRAVSAREEGAAIVAYLTKCREGLELGAQERERRRQAADRARVVATGRVGAERAAEYEELRRRLSDPSEIRDDLTRAAYEALEHDRRSALRDYASALDQLDTAPAPHARFVAFAGDAGTVLVAPVRAAVEIAAGALATRLACAFWHATERAAMELADGGSIEDGSVAGLLAVRFPTMRDAALLEVLIDETVSTRPSLEALGVEAEFELAEGIGLEFVSAPESDVEVGAAGGAPAGSALPFVAARVGLSVRDLVAALHDRGLPFPDDEVEPGAEQTLRVLLGEEPHAREVAPAAASVMASTVGAPALVGNADIASRLLGKLLRDRRVGGRHTRMDNAWGHHFADGEKHVARRIAEWMERDGIFIPKNNEGSHHISINPRRLRDVREIIDGRWARCVELGQL